jgi:hypothetical protein
MEAPSESGASIVRSFSTATEPLEENIKEY